MTDSGRIVGFIEAISDRGIAGWAFRAGDAAPLRLALRIDGGAAVEVVCDRAREDVWALRTDLHAECRHGPMLGFLAEIPAECFDGQAHGFVLETADGVPAELKTAGLASEVMPEAGAVVEDDPDDGGLAFTGLPRATLFGIGAELAALRADFTGPGAEVGVYAADPERTVGSEFDRAYYLGANSDVRASGADPVLHYVRQGWREGRKPAAWFDTDYYLAANPDVREAGVNPFWHYLALGRPEGRARWRWVATTTSRCPPVSRTISRTTSRTKSGIFTQVLVVTSPATTTSPVQHSVSQATRDIGSLASMASSTASEI